ncbi:MAG: hypothetical protein ACRD3O_13280 [Terriglobia bacterium]
MLVQVFPLTRIIHEGIGIRRRGISQGAFDGTVETVPFRLPWQVRE